MSTSRPYRVLFVCLGNICRSPAAEIIFKQMVQEKGLTDQIESDSAGMMDYHQGDPPDLRMQSALRRYGYQNPGVVSRPITGRDLDYFDLILYMDAENLRWLEDMKGYDSHCQKIIPMCDYAVNFCDKEVADPYFGKAEGFNHTVELLQDICANLLAKIEEKL